MFFYSCLALLVQLKDFLMCGSVQGRELYLFIIFWIISVVLYISDGFDAQSSTDW